jgi:hypothetical protein
LQALFSAKQAGEFAFFILLWSRVISGFSFFNRAAEFQNFIFSYAAPFYAGKEECGVEQFV